MESNNVMMWQVLMDHFRRYPAQERVVRMMIEQGLRIHDGKIHSGPVEVADTAMARAANVDRRIVRSAVKAIEAHPDLARVFRRFESTLLLKGVAPEIGCGVIEIIPDDADAPGILAGVAKAISSHGISIRQAIVEDPDFTQTPRLYVISETKLEPFMIPLLQEVEGVRGVAVY